MKRIALWGITVAWECAAWLVRYAYKRDLAAREKVRAAQVSIADARRDARIRLGLCQLCERPGKSTCDECYEWLDKLGLDPHTLKTRGGIEA